MVALYLRSASSASRLFMLFSLLTAAPLLLPMSPVPPSAASLAGREKSRLKTEQVEFETSDSQHLRGTYYPPKKRGQLAPGAILVHDSGGDRAQLAPLGAKLQKAGFAVLTLDLRGHGESADPDSAWSKLDGTDQQNLWVYARRDLEAAALWLGKRPEVHSTNLNLVGLEIGCTLAVAHAARDQNINAVVLIAPPQTPALGFELDKQILDLEGLPSCVFTTRGQRDSVKSMVDMANSQSSAPYIDLLVGKSKTEEVLSDKRMVRDVTEWLEQHATPQKGAS